MRTEQPHKCEGEVGAVKPSPGGSLLAGPGRWFFVVVLCCLFLVSEFR